VGYIDSLNILGNLAVLFSLESLYQVGLQVAQKTTEQI
jgi:hypothetical protein